MATGQPKQKQKLAVYAGWWKSTFKGGYYDHFLDSSIEMKFFVSDDTFLCMLLSKLYVNWMTLCL